MSQPNFLFYFLHHKAITMKAFAKSLSVFLLAICFFLTVIGLIFFDNIKGYYTFKEYCEKEGGLTVYEPIEKNVGWWAKDKTDARFAASLDHIGFVRYLEKDNQLYDLKPVGPRNTLNPEHEVNNANLAVEPIYKLESESYSSRSPHQPSRVTYQVKNFSNEKLIVKFNIYHYGFFNEERTPMGVNQKFSCFDDVVLPYERQWKFEINNTFKK